jgi:rhomboid protease GluP
MSDKPSKSSHPLYDSPVESAPPPEQPDDSTQQKRITLPGVQSLPYLTYALIVINSVLYFMRYLNTELAFEILVWGVADVPQIVNGDYYRLFTSMFLHANEAHIFFNMLMLYYVGARLEKLFGSVRFGLVYFLGGLGGAALMLLAGTGGLGASGAVFAIFAAEAVYFWLHRDLYGEMAESRVRNALILIVVNFVFGFVANISANVTEAENAVRISNAAHFGGLAGGAILAYWIAPRYVMRKRTDPPQAASLPAVALSEDVQVVRDNPLDDRWQELLGFIVGLLLLVGLGLVLYGA